MHNKNQQNLIKKIERAKLKKKYIIFLILMSLFSIIIISAIIANLIHNALAFHYSVILTSLMCNLILLATFLFTYKMLEVNKEGKLSARFQNFCFLTFPWIIMALSSNIVLILTILQNKNVIELSNIDTSILLILIPFIIPCALSLFLIVASSFVQFESLFKNRTFYKNEFYLANSTKVSSIVSESTVAFAIITTTYCLSGKSPIIALPIILSFFMHLCFYFAFVPENIMSEPKGKEKHFVRIAEYAVATGVIPATVLLMALTFKLKYDINLFNNLEDLALFLYIPIAAVVILAFISHLVVHIEENQQKNMIPTLQETPDDEQENTITSKSIKDPIASAQCTAEMSEPNNDTTLTTADTEPIKSPHTSKDH